MFNYIIIIFYYCHASRWEDLRVMTKSTPSTFRRELRLPTASSNRGVFSCKVWWLRSHREDKVVLFKRRLECLSSAIVVE